MLARQKIWIPASQHYPKHYFEFSKAFLQYDPISRTGLESVSLTPASLHVALAPATRPTEVPTCPPNTVAEMLAVSFKVTREVCNDTTGIARMSDGYISTLVDCINSFHIMERIIPKPYPHVSVNMQFQYHDLNALHEGANVVLVSTLDKLGKRIAYCHTDIYADPAEVSDEVASQDAAVATVEDLRKALKQYRSLVHSSHVKMIIESRVERSEKKV